MSLTSETPKRFFISLALAHDGDCIHADLEDGTSLLLVLRHNKKGWRLVFDERDLPEDLVHMAGELAPIALRQQKEYIPYSSTRLNEQQIAKQARKICRKTRLIGVEKLGDGACIDAGSRLWARVGDDPEFGIATPYQKRWRASAPLAKLVGPCVHEIHEQGVS